MFISLEVKTGTKIPISYGDGERETLCLKLTIPVFRQMGRTKYTHSMVRRVVMRKSLLSEAEAYEYRHNTTVGGCFYFVNISSSYC